MGDAREYVLKVDFDRRLRLEFHGAKVTSDAGLLAYRELDDVFGLTKMAAGRLSDSRTGKNTQHSMTALLRQAVLGRLAGYEDTNDADRLRVDPAMRHVVGGRARELLGASTSEMSRFETELLACRENILSLMDLCGRWIDKTNERTALKELVLDLDSSESPTYGHQQGTAFNGYFGCTCYHPLFLFNQSGDLERAMLRRGNVHSSKYWRRVLLPVIDRYRNRPIPKYFRGDAAFAVPGLFRVLEAEDYGYAIRIKSNRKLESKIAHLMRRPVGRPSRKPKVFYHNFDYQAGTWTRPRRI
ncbi:MAG: IS1380 family transposase, partial [Planctomycetota bacterium]